MSQQHSKAVWAHSAHWTVRQSAPRRRNSVKARRDELEIKFAALQKDYAELHTSIFEAAQVHRRLCAPRLVRCGDFEIASEIFAVRHLAGDFFTVRNCNRGVVMALGDICGKGLAAGMWTTHLVGAGSQPHRGIFRPRADSCRCESRSVFDGIGCAPRQFIPRSARSGYGAA